MKQTKLAAFFMLFPIAVQIPFTILTIKFGYPDILRENGGLVMTRFAEGGTPLIWTWYAYSMSILFFLGALFQLSQVKNLYRSKAIFTVGLVSSLVQMIALVRWTFLVPFLSRAYVDSSDLAVKKSLEVIFDIQNSFLGIGLGEHLGQMTLVAWTVLLVGSVIKEHKMTRSLGYVSAITLLAGLSEHLATALGHSVTNLDKVTMVGFILWSVWMITVGVKVAISKSTAFWVVE